MCVLSTRYHISQASNPKSELEITINNSSMDYMYASASANVNALCKSNSISKIYILCRFFCLDVYVKFSALFSGSCDSNANARAWYAHEHMFISIVNITWLAYMVLRQVNVFIVWLLIW